MTGHRLDGLATTLLLLQRGRELPEIVHWGPRLPDGLDLDGVASLRDRATRRNGLDQDHVEAVLMPTLGTGALRAPALAASRGGIDWTADFTEVAVHAELKGRHGRAVDDAHLAGLVGSRERPAHRVDPPPLAPPPALLPPLAEYEAVGGGGF